MYYCRCPRAAFFDALGVLLARFSPQLPIYPAGASPHEGERLGRLKLSLNGLAERDRLVIGQARQRDIPLAVTMAGRYGKRPEDTVAAHIQTIPIAAHLPRFVRNIRFNNKACLRHDEHRT